jgi:putative DNA primase/helicase
MRVQVERNQLAEIGANLVRMLGGRWQDGGGMCRCPAHADRTPSLSIRLGHTSLLVHCFAGCTSREVLAAIRQFEPHMVAATSRYAPMPVRNDDWMRKRAADIWDEAHLIGGSPAERYLIARSITLGSDALRYHARAPLGRGQNLERRPALIAKVSDDNALVAVQRIFIDPHRPRRARNLGNPRRLLGRPGTGAVRLVEPGTILGLAEGVETALSAMILLGIPVWAVLGNERFAHVAVPASVARLILLPDNDEAGRRGSAAGYERHQSRSRQVETLFPWRGLNDWNDVLRSEGEEGGRQVRLAV